MSHKVRFLLGTATNEPTVYWLKPDSFYQCYSKIEFTALEDWLNTTDIKWKYNVPIITDETMNSIEKISIDMNGRLSTQKFRELIFENEIEMKLFKMAFNVP